MPKFSTSARHSSHQDGKKKSKHRGHQYLGATRARKLKQTRFKGIVEEIIEPVESGKPRPLKRTKVVNMVRFGRKMQANCEKNQPVSVPIIPAEVYAPNPVNPNVPRVIMTISEETAKRKQVTATDDDGDTTDVDESEDLIVLPAGFIEVAEMLGVLNPSPASSGPHDELEEFVSATEPPPVAERRSTKIETPLNSPPLTVPQTISSVPSTSSSTQSLHMVPEPEVVNNASQIAADTSSPVCLAEQNAPISMPHAASVPESFQEATCSSAPDFQHSTSWQNNMNSAETFNLHQQDIQNGFSTDDDVNMDLGEAAMEPSVYSVPTTWTSSQPQHQMFYSHVGQVTDNINQYQTYNMGNIHANWASMPVQNESTAQFAQINQPRVNHPVDPFTAAMFFWASLSEKYSTSQSPTTAPEIIQSTPTPSNQLDEEPSKLPVSDEPICQDGQLDIIRRNRLENNGGCHPFPNLRGCKNMRYINMNGELKESRIVQPIPGRRRVEKPPVGSEMDLVARLKRESEGPQMRRRKRRHEDSQPDIACTSKSDVEVPRQRRRCQPDASELKTSVPAQKRSRKPRVLRQRKGSLKEPASSRFFNILSIDHLSCRPFV